MNGAQAGECGPAEVEAEAEAEGGECGPRGARGRADGRSPGAQRGEANSSIARLATHLHTSSAIWSPDLVWANTTEAPRLH